MNANSNEWPRIVRDYSDVPRADIDAEIHAQAERLASEAKLRAQIARMAGNEYRGRINAARKPKPRIDWLCVAVWGVAAPLVSIGGWLLAGAVLVTVLAPAVRDAIALMAGG